MSANVKQALSLLKRDFFLFPLEEEGKTPRDGFHWKARATQDVEFIKRMFFVPGEMKLLRPCNLAISCGPSGIIVIDLDVKDALWGPKDPAKHGVNNFRALEKKYGKVKTLTARTASGGLHLFFRNTAGLGCSTGFLAPGIDTKGIGGYVVAPGSYVVDDKGRYEGPYEWVDPSVPIVDLPEWLADLLASTKHKPRAARGAVEIEDDPRDIEEAKRWLLEDAEHAVEGSGGDHTTFATAAHLRDQGCSKETALELMLEHWNDECSPPWDPEELAEKVDNAYRYARNPTGHSSVTKEATLEEEFGKQERGKTPIGIVKFDLDGIPKRDWIFGNLALAGNVSIGVAPPGAGKSTFTINAALSKASGRNLLDQDPIRAGNVWLINNEDTEDEIRRRIAGAMRAHGVSFDEITTCDELGNNVKPRIFLNSADNDTFRIAKRAGKGELKPKDMQWMIDHITENNIKMVVVDPLVSTHPAAENSNEEIEAMADMYRKVAQWTGAAVILIHHTKKLDIAASTGHNGNIDTIRGASALAGVARIVFTLFTMDEKSAKEYGVDPEKRRSYIGLAMAKANMSEIDMSIVWYEKFGERIGMSASDPDGESVGVIRPAHLRRVSSPEDLRDGARELLHDAEEFCHGKTVRLRQLCETIVDKSSTFMGKNARTLERTLRRLFRDGERAIKGKRNTLKLIEIDSHLRHGPKKVLAISLSPFTSTPEEMELM